MLMRPFFALAVVAPIVLAGCGDGGKPSTASMTPTGTGGRAVPVSKLHGKWDATMPNGAKAVATFNTDGTCVFDAPNPAAPTMIIKMMGEYREEGDTLFLKWTDAAFENTPAEAKSQEAGMLEKLKKTINLGKEVNAKLTWEGDDAFKTTSREGKVGTFKRK